MQFVINSKVQVIVLGFTAVIRLVISSFWLRYVIKMENSDILISCLSKLSVIEMETSTFQECFRYVHWKKLLIQNTRKIYFWTLSRMDFVTWFLLDTFTLMRIFLAKVVFLQVRNCSGLKNLNTSLCVANPKQQWFLGFSL